MQTLLHNPTGGNADPASCHRVLSLAEQYGFAVVEDDVYGDLAYDGTRPRPAKAFDKDGLVLLCGSCPWKSYGTNRPWVFEPQGKAGTDAGMIFRPQFGARFAPSKIERQVGETGAHPSTLGRRKYPPQAIENSKIMGVSV